MNLKSTLRLRPSPSSKDPGPAPWHNEDELDGSITDLRMKGITVTLVLWTKIGEK